MTIFAQWSSFRHGFADRALAYEKAMTFTAATNSVQRTDGGNFVTEGHAAGQRANVSNTTNNNFALTIATVVADTLTFVETGVVVNEVCAAATIESYDVDPDGVPTWPIALVRAGGFDGGLSGLPALPSLSTPIVITAGGTSCEWYVSQRSDVAAEQFWTVTPFAVDKGVILTASSLATQEFQGMTTVTPEAIPSLFRDLHVYARKSGTVGEIQWLDVYRELAST